MRFNDTAVIAAVLLLIATPAAVAGGFVEPNHELTPGAIVSRSAEAVCKRGYARSIRPRYDYVWRKFRASVFAAYHIPHDAWRSYTIDHLVPLELGGAPMDLRNVWPEPKTEARRKDHVEDKLHAAVCYDRSLTLEAAQSAIAHDWTRTTVGTPPARPHGRSEAYAD